MKELIAHINNEKVQSLQNHSKNVSNIAKEFASSFANEDWAEYAGLFHDLGKAFPEWQNYLLKNSSTKINHSEAGAQYAFSKYNPKDPFAKIIPYVIAGHHAGLPDYHEGSGNSLKSIIEKCEYKILLDIPELQIYFRKELPKSPPFGKNKDKSPDLMEYLHLWIRMLYSCLVDADFLDTETFMESEKADLRGKYKTLVELKPVFDSYMHNIQEKSNISKMNEIRNSIFKSCIDKAYRTSGFYSLNVPTGGGKTLSSMAFALNHAIKNNKKRIIMAIPYTSIIEQTAAIYKDIFGEENVLEHHCNFDFESITDKELSSKQKLATENWDSPIIVTTNVQLFESLFNAHSSGCRKLHNLIDSIIILDEVQMLPPDYLKSILSALQGLVKCFGVTVVLCTATQPALEGKIGSDNGFNGIPENLITPIIDNPEELSEQLKRVEFNTDYTKDKVTDWQKIANKLTEYKQVLCIVNTRKDCRELHSLMPEGTYHLSALMCAEERSEIIAEIKEKLKNNESVRVISTQLIECGVDVDFPVVFRAIAGLDSIAQSAGRCNREGKLKKGTLFLFESPTETPIGLQKKAVNVTKEILLLNDYKLEMTPDLYKTYFTKFFKTVNDFDKPDFEETMQKERFEAQFQFRTLSDNYHLIENGYQGTVYIKYCSTKTGKHNYNLLSQLQSGEIDKSLMRKLTRYSVNLSVKDIKELIKEGRIIQPIEGIFMQSMDDDNLYQNGLGLVADSTQSFNTYVF